MTLNSFNSLENRPKPKISWPTVVIIGSYHVGVLFAPWCFSWSAVGVAIALNWLIGCVGICLGYHRLLSHRSFVVPKFLERAIATLGALSFQGGPIFWASAHRRHHRHTEHVDKDPYSASRGFWWSHIGWIFYDRPEFWYYEYYKKFAPDLDRDPYYRWLDFNFMWLQVVLGIALYLAGGWSFLIYGLFVRNIYERHVTFLVNSACHMFGYRSYDSEDNSRNLWWAAVLAYGEGWHNNHHAYPNSAQTGMKWWEFDITWQTIRLLKALGLAKQVRTPSGLQ